MSPADSARAQSAALSAVARVLRVDPSGMRADTPLAALGWDSLAGLCWQDAMTEAGWATDSSAVHRASTVGDLAECASVSEVGL